MATQYTNGIKYRKLDENGDYMIGRANEFHEGLEAMAQAIKTRLKAIQGEWWEGDSTALPFMSEIIGTTRKDKSQLDLMVIHRITDTIGVISVENIKSSLEGRTYSFSCDVKTIYGNTSIEVNV